MLDSSYGSLACPIVVGRRRELDLLDQFLRGDGRSVLLLSGESGIGKSRLVAEAIHQSVRISLRVLRGACFEPDRDVPYAPLIDLLRDVKPLGISAETDHATRLALEELGELLPELAFSSRGGVTRSGAVEPEQHRRRVSFALVDLLGKLSREAQLLVVLEDLHWSDEASLDLLSHIIRHLAGTPARLLLTYRGDEPHGGLTHFVAELLRERIAQEIVLTPLAREDVDAMVEAILGPSRPISLDLRHTLFRLTEGNPFFVEEIIASLAALDTQLAVDDPGGPFRVPMVPVPRTVYDAIQQRLAKLSEPARQVLTLGAVAGRRFDFALLQELTRRGEPELVTIVKELIGHHLVVEESADQFAFRHALTREAVYFDLLARERRELHRMIGQAMEQLAEANLGARAADLAYHFFLADVWAKALEYSNRAGEQALSIYAPAAAVEHFSRAIVAAGKMAGPESSRLYRSRGLAHETLGNFDRALADFSTAGEIAQLAGDLRAQWQVQLDLAGLWSSRDYVRTGESIRRALEIARTLEDPATLAHTLNRLGNWHTNREEVSDALNYHREALAVFERLGDRRGVAETLDVLGMTEAIGSDLARSAETYEQAIPLLRELDDRPRLVIDLTIRLLATGFYWSDVAVPAAIDRSEAMAAAQEALTIARDIGWRSGEAFVLYELALWHGPRGEFAPALELAAAGLAVADEIQHQEWIVGARCALGAVYLDLLSFAEAHSHLDIAFTLAQQIDSSIWIRLAASVLAATHLARGQLARAANVLDRAIHAHTPMQTLGQRRCWCVRGELALATGEAARALDIADRLIDLTPGGSVRMSAPRLMKLRGEALLALRRGAEAEATLRVARDDAESLGLRPLLWRIDTTLGRLYLGQGERREAQQAFASARATIEALASELPEGALGSGFRVQAHSHLPAARTPSPGRQAKEKFGGLTARERDVAKRIAAGKSNRAIAEDLVIAERTVESYVSNILAKLDFRSRSQIASWAIETGLTRLAGSRLDKSPRARDAGRDETEKRE